MKKQTKSVLLEVELEAVIAADEEFLAQNQAELSSGNVLRASDCGESGIALGDTNVPLVKSEEERRKEEKRRSILVVPASFFFFFFFSFEMNLRQWSHREDLRGRSRRREAPSVLLEVPLQLG